MLETAHLVFINVRDHYAQSSHYVPVWGRGTLFPTPLFPLIHLLPHLLLFFTFSLFPFLIRFTDFLFCPFLPFLPE